MKVGIKDVAQVAGVSPATVSRTLAGKVADLELRARVESAVKQTGYRPNLAARRLRSQHSNTIGLIVADIRNPFFTAVSRTVEDIAYAHQLRVILCNTDENPQKEEMYLRLMAEERITGVIFAPTRASAARIAREQHEFPIVLIDRSRPSRLHDAVVLDNVAASAMLVEHMLDRGYRRIAGLFTAASITGAERRQGYEAAMAQAGAKPHSVLVEHGSAGVATAIDGLLAHKSRPDAILASNGVMLMEITRALIGAGVHIPDDIGLAGFDNDPWTELVAGGLTVIEQPVEDIGRSAMSMLLGRREAREAPARKLVLQPRCIQRASTKGPGH